MNSKKVAGWVLIVGSLASLFGVVSVLPLTAPLWGVVAVAGSYLAFRPSR